MMYKEDENKIQRGEEFKVIMHPRTSGTGAQRREYIDGRFIKMNDRGKHQAQSEVYASQISKFFKNIEVLEYWPEGDIMCSSLNMCEEGEILLPLYSFIKDRRGVIDQNLSTPRDWAGEVSKEMGIPSEEIMGWTIKTLIWDRIIMNMDRHLNNFAVIYDIQGDKYRLAPIFDNGCSFLLDKSTTIHTRLNYIYGGSDWDVYEALMEQDTEELFKPFRGIDLTQYSNWALEVDIEGLIKYLQSIDCENVKNTVMAGLIKNSELLREVKCNSGVNLEWEDV